MEGCKEIITEAWSTKSEPAGIRGLMGKLDSCKSALQQWKRRNVRNSAVLIEELHGQLVQIQGRRVDEYNLEEENEIKSNLTFAMQQEEQYWLHRSRVKWLNFGDHNTKFFHNTTLRGRAEIKYTG